MKKRTFSFMLFSNLIALTMLALFTRNVSAASEFAAKPPPPPPPLTPTLISLSNLGVQDLGVPFKVQGVADVSGKPLATTSITITLNGKYLGQTSTDEKGLFEYSVHQDLPVGTYVLSANYFGSHQLAAANASIPLQIRPYIFVIQTIPPTSGIPFLMDGRQFVSDAEGVAKIAISKTGTYRLEAQPEKYVSQSQRIGFGRWEDENFHPFRDVQIPATGPLQVGFDVYHQVDQTFVDLDGVPVDPQRVTAITIKSAQGDIFSYKEGQRIWVPASRINRRSAGLEVAQLLYSVINVTIDGSNVVNKAQQRFYTGTDKTWTISLTLYSIGVTARDAFFGSPVGQSISLLYPNGKVDTFLLDKAGGVKLPSLARGIYKIKLSGTNGINTLTPVALSRNQVINENVITYLDIGIAFGFGLAIALGLIFFGRPWLLFPRMRRLDLEPAVVSERDPIYLHDN